MAQAPEDHRGGCLCGAVRNRVTGPLRPVGACECGQCRRTSGNDVAATPAPRDAVTASGDVAWSRSSGAARRGVCPVCGPNLFWDGTGANLSIMAGTLDLPSGLTVTGHIFCGGRGDWCAPPEGERQVPGAGPSLTTQVPA